ncbi:unnamed protein product [Meganyctiphanes norvegica]|uniref:Uncharacterized protein n=1 Tax=Meganyctiphanes norvegica TaxID=48144 RepID=A0AAV2QTF4_MEGNR
MTAEAHTREPSTFCNSTFLTLECFSSLGNHSSNSLSLPGFNAIVHLTVSNLTPSQSISEAGATAFSGDSSSPQCSSSHPRWLKDSRALFASSAPPKSSRYTRIWALLFAIFASISIADWQQYAELLRPMASLVSM